MINRSLVNRVIFLDTLSTYFQTFLNFHDRFLYQYLTLLSLRTTLSQVWHLVIAGNLVYFCTLRENNNTLSAPKGDIFTYIILKTRIVLKVWFFLQRNLFLVISARSPLLSEVIWRITSEVIRVRNFIVVHCA